MARVRGTRQSSGKARATAGRVKLRLTGYDGDGSAVGVIDGRECHVARGARGDIVEVAVDHVSPHAPVCWGRILKIIDPGPGRVSSPCAVSDRCGGCPWIHLDYREQLREKTERARRVAGDLGFDGDVAVSPSPESFHYRNRGKYVVAKTRAGLVLGAYAPRSHRVVGTLGCVAVEPVVDQVARGVATVLSDVGVSVYHPGSGRGLLRYVAVRANHRSKTLVTLVAAGDPSPSLIRAAQRIGASSDVAGVTLDLNADPGNAIFSGHTRSLSGNQMLVEQFGTVSVELAGHSFGQVNRAQAVRMYEHVVELALSPLGLGPVRRVLELFSGSGAMSLMLAGAGVPVRGVEVDAAAVESASRSAAALGLEDLCRFVSADADEAFYDVTAGFEPDVVVVNPPRRGLGPSLVMALARARVARIVYVSCNPTTLLRDAGFLRDVGYYVRDIHGFDMMPHTPHIEIVCVLQRPQAILDNRSGR